MLSVLTVHVVYSRFADEVCVRCRGVGNSCSWGPATNLEDLDNSSCEGSGVSGHDNVTLAGFHINASKGWLLLLSAHNKARVLGERLLLCYVGSAVGRSDGANERSVETAGNVMRSSLVASQLT